MVVVKYSSTKFINRARKILRLSYLLLLEHLPKVFIARVLIEPSSAAGQNIVRCWLHCLYYFLRDRWWLFFPWHLYWILVRFTHTAFMRWCLVSEQFVRVYYLWGVLVGACIMGVMANGKKQNRVRYVVALPWVSSEQIWSLFVSPDHAVWIDQYPLTTHRLTMTLPTLRSWTDKLPCIVTFEAWHGGAQSSNKRAVYHLSSSLPGWQLKLVPTDSLLVRHGLSILHCKVDDGKWWKYPNIFFGGSDKYHHLRYPLTTITTSHVNYN